MIADFFVWLQGFFETLLGGKPAVSPPALPVSTGVATGNAGRAPSGFTVGQWVKYDATFKFWAKSYGVDWQWLKAFALNESRLGLDARVARGGVSSDGLSYGLMQFTFPTASDMKGSPATVEDLNNPELSIQWGAKYVAWLYEYLDEDLEKAVQAYNCGPGNVLKGKTVPEYLARWKRNLALVEAYQ